jgi:hypothetical protein
MLYWIGRSMQSPSLCRSAAVQTNTNAAPDWAQSMQVASQSLAHEGFTNVQACGAALRSVAGVVAGISERICNASAAGLVGSLDTGRLWLGNCSEALP